MNGIEFLKESSKYNAIKLMEKYKFPNKIINDFERKNIVYMSLPNGRLTTDFPEVVIKRINQMSPKRCVYHVLAHYSSSHCYCTCLMYHLFIAENYMEVFTDCPWIPVYSVNFTIPDWSGDGNVQIKRYRKGIKCIEIRYLDS